MTEPQKFPHNLWDGYYFRCLLTFRGKSRIIKTSTGKGSAFFYRFFRPKGLRVKYLAFLSLVGGLVFSAVAAEAPPYTPSQSTPKVVIETIAGDITIELFPNQNQAPVTCNNFLQYVNAGFYDGTIFHRAIQNFMIQGGGFEPKGVLRSDGLHWRIEGLRPPIINESYNGLSNLRATIAMARTNDPNSATSQFYINVINNTFLDRTPTSAGYCVFGQVISGMEVVDQIVQLPAFPSFYSEGFQFTDCPNDSNNYVKIYRQQVRVCVSPSGNDTTGLGSVDSPLKTIQKAIDVVNEPGHVVLTPATYTGAGNVDVNFKGRAITVRAIEPNDVNTVTKTVINCQGTSASKHRAFYFHTDEDANSVVQGLTIINGYQTSGGAIRCDNSSPTIRNCTIIKNTASSYGGGIYDYNSDAIIANCTFSKNTALSKGGALCCDYGSSTALTNSILWQDVAPSGNEIAITSSATPSITTVSYSDIDGGQPSLYKEAGCSVVWGTENLDIDPCFVNADSNDFHLQSRQRQWEDANGWKQGRHTSPCIDAGNPGSPVGYEPNTPTNIRIDMGSYGGTTKAGIPPQYWGLLADLDNDGITDAKDFAFFAGFWKHQGSELPADLDRNGVANIADLQLFSEDWLRIATGRLAEDADFSGDGIVNFKDFAVLAGEWMEEGDNKTSDLNGDGIVNIDDLDLLTKVWLR
jgi:parallel beta-helix repeat protein